MSVGETINPVSPPGSEFLAPGSEQSAAQVPSTLAEGAGLSAKLPGFRLALFATCLACVVVVLGAFTRLVDAGLGCPDWPGCYGHLSWPNTHEEIARAEALFPEAPVATDKTWPEMVHRYFAGSLGLVIVCIGLLSWHHHRKNKRLGAGGYGRNIYRTQPLKLPLALIALVIVQALFGMWTVTLKLWPQVVTSHLLGGFTTLSLLWLLVLRLSNMWNSSVYPAQFVARISALRPWAFAGLVVVVAQIALGGWMSSNYAALACVDLPTCHGVWWPQTDFVRGFNIFQHIGPNYLGGLMDNEARTAIHLSHRLGAVLAAAVTLVLAAKLWSLNTRGFRYLAVALSLLLGVQVMLGISNIVWILPLPVTVAHNGVGALLLLALVTVNYGLYCAANKRVVNH